MGTATCRSPVGPARTLTSGRSRPGRRSGDGQEAEGHGGSVGVVRALGGRSVTGADQRELGVGPQDGPQVSGPGGR